MQTVLSHFAAGVKVCLKIESAYALRFQQFKLLLTLWPHCCHMVQL